MIQKLKKLFHSILPDFIPSKVHHLKIISSICEFTERINKMIAKIVIW